MWFDSWSDIIRVILVGIASYAALVVSIRLAGKRTLAQLNAFDFVVTVALGSTLATILLSSDVAFSEGVTAILLLLALQVIVAFASTRSVAVRKAAVAEPTLLLRDGRFDDEAMRRHRISLADVEQSVRQSGEGDVSSIAAVVLEGNGRISVIPRSKLGDGSSLGSLQ